MVDIPLPSVMAVQNQVKPPGDITPSPFKVSSTNKNEARATPLISKAAEDAIAELERLSAELHSDKAAEDALDELERLSEELHSEVEFSPRRTFLGLPGGSTGNPFSRNQEKTAAAKIQNIQALAATADSEADDDVALEQGMDKTEEKKIVLPDEPELLSDPTVEQASPVPRKISSSGTLLGHDAVAAINVQASRHDSPPAPTPADPATAVTDDVGVFSSVEKDKIRARLERKRRKSGLEASSSEAQEISDGQSSEVEVKAPAVSMGDIASESDPDPDPVAAATPPAAIETAAPNPTLASLFKKVRERHAGSGGDQEAELPAPRGPDLPAPRQPTPALPMPKGKASRGGPGELPMSRGVNAAPALSEDEIEALLADSTDLFSEASVVRHDGLFADTPRGSTAPALPPIPGVSNKAGRVTSGSMLARLQKRKEAEAGGKPAAQEEAAQAEAAESVTVSEQSSLLESPQPTSEDSAGLPASEALATEELDGLLEPQGAEVKSQIDAGPSTSAPPSGRVKSSERLQADAPSVSAPVIPPPEVVPSKQLEPPAVQSDVRTEKSPDKGKRKKPVFVLAAMALLAIAAVVFVIQGGLDTAIPSTGSSPLVTAPAAQAEAPEASKEVAEAMGQASANVWRALPQGLMNPEQRISWAREQLAAGRSSEAIVVLQAQWATSPTAEVFDAYSQALEATDSQRELRSLIAEAMGHASLSEKVRALHNKSRAEAHTVDLGSDRSFKLLTFESRHGLDTLVFESGGRRFAFKPAQPGFDDGWRNEIALFRLCEVIVCSFQVPETHHARLAKADFDGLLTAIGDAQKSGIAKAPWSWREVETVGVLEGSLQEIIEPAARWPIEDLPLWREWLSVTSSPVMLEAPLASQIDRLRQRAGEDAAQAVLTAAGSPMTKALARQISDVLVVDFLTNNWERFQSRPDLHGTLTPLASGRIVSVHNSDAFQPRSSRRVQGRFEWTSRYSRTMVDAIRALEPDTLNDYLFPSATAVERVKLEVFWSQRNQVLKRVDALIERHGPDAVLYFD
jgi:hypothetical protein